MSIDLSPEEFRRLGYRAIDMLADRLAGLNDAPVRQPVPDDVRAMLMNEPPPDQPRNPDDVLDRVMNEVLAYPMGNGSPRFFGWVNSPPAPLAVLGDLLAAGLNPSVAGGDHAATYVEHGVLNWLKAMMTFPPETGAILTSGGSVANLTGLAVMRHVKAAGNVREDGFTDEAAPMVVYTSEQGHSCIEKSVHLLGIGGKNLHKIPVDADYRMDLSSLRQRIAGDRAEGLRPVCVVASAGTVNTGAIDPLDALADVCAAEDLWLHVDGAYGGFGILAEQTQGMYAGINHADSLAVDPHKWLYVPVECGCTLVRDAGAMRDTFSLVPPYLRDEYALPWFAEFGFQQTRGFKALKLWLTMQQIGVSGYRTLISRDIALAHRLREKIAAHPDFEVFAAGPLSVTCFRYKPAGAADLNTLQQAIPTVVQAEGRAFVTSTVLNGQTVLRACTVNFRTTESDLDALLDAVKDAGDRLL